MLQCRLLISEHLDILFLSWIYFVSWHNSRNYIKLIELGIDLLGTKLFKNIALRKRLFHVLLFRWISLNLRL